MRGLLSTVLILSLLVPFYGAWQFLSLQIQQIRKEVHNTIRQDIPEEHLITMTFTAEESKTLLEWEHEDEFEYKGVMYDVIRSSADGNKIKYVCYRDVRETAVKNQMRNVVAKAIAGDPQHQSKENQISFFLKTLFANSSSGLPAANYMGSLQRLKPYLPPASNTDHLPVFHPPDVKQYS